MGTCDCFLCVKQLHVILVFLGGLVFSVLATGLKVRGFKPGRERCIFKDNKKRNTPSFGGEVKALAKCRKIFRRDEKPIEI
jgi:hypothetical protein